jgi:energy-converting hydrogenase Eha subunit E
MPRPSHGQTGLLFLSVCSPQAISLLITLSLTSRFISTLIESSQTSPPSPLIVILIITILSCIYCILSLFLYFDHQLPLLPSIAVGGALFLAMLISAVILGKPLSFISCTAIVGQTT